MAGRSDRDSNDAPAANAPGHDRGRWLRGALLAGGAVIVATLLTLGRGLLFPIPSKAQASARKAAPGSPDDAHPNAAAGQPAPPSLGGPLDPRPARRAPPPDPRIVRAMRTPVVLRAGTASVRTELSQLGVRLTWPAAGAPRWSISTSSFDHGVRRLARRVERRPLNARLLHTGSGFRALTAHPGRELDRSAARRELLALLSHPAFQEDIENGKPAPPASLKLVIPLREVPPSGAGGHLGAINTLLASYSTGLGSSSRNRRHNIRVACAAIDGTVLWPGDVFSYNQTVGPRTERAGFRTAPVIIHGELVPGTGGGVCQVSTTLYNVALLGDLRIVRRTHHHFPVHYVPPGRDATVAYGSLDLRFANSLPGPVALDVKTAGSRVVVRLYGTAECKRQVRLVTTRLGHPPRRRGASSGDRAVGKRVIVTRLVRLDDGDIQREVISRDSYSPPPPSSHASLSRRSSRRHRHRERPRHLLEPHKPSPTNNPLVRAGAGLKGG